jgi:hypothetical protein
MWEGVAALHSAEGFFFINRSSNLPNYSAQQAFSPNLNSYDITITKDKSEKFCCVSKERNSFLPQVKKL